jgi:hypothetical protein
MWAFLLQNPVKFSLTLLNVSLPEINIVILRS